MTRVPGSGRPGRIARSLLVAIAAGVVVAACGGGASETTKTPTAGAEIYTALCATCHAANGGGFVGPSLVDSAARYPDIADEIAIVTNGRLEMPAWSGRLTASQIRAVVEYTRTAFTSGASAPTSTEPFVGPTIATTAP